MIRINYWTGLVPRLLMAGIVSSLLAAWFRGYRSPMLGTSQSKLVSTYGQPVRLIANGSTASVYLHWHPTGDEKYAIKRFKDQAETTSETAYTNRVMGEAIVDAHLSPHSSILKMQDFFQDSGKWYAVMRYIPTTLFDRTLGNGDELSLDDKICVWIRILDGIRHMHSEGVAHLDLKLNNILLEDGMWPKIIDFGTSQVDWTNPRVENWISGRRGTPPFAPPEAYVQAAYDAYAADIWALAMIWCQMMLPTVPWKSTDNEAGAERFEFFDSTDSDADVRHTLAKIGDNRSMINDYELQQATADRLRASVVMISNYIKVEESRGIFQRMLEVDTKKRPTAAELMQDPWIERQAQNCGDLSD